MRKNGGKFVDVTKSRRIVVDRCWRVIDSRHRRKCINFLNWCDLPFEFVTCFLLRLKRNQSTDVMKMAAHSWWNALALDKALIEWERERTRIVRSFKAEKLKIETDLLAPRLFPLLSAPFPPSLPLCRSFSISVILQSSTLDRFLRRSSFSTRTGEIRCYRSLRKTLMVYLRKKFENSSDL